MADKYIGKCTNCGLDNVELNVLDDVNHICNDCLDGNYFFCEDCNQYWHCDYVERYELSDGRTVCEHCLEDVDDDEPVKKLQTLIRAISEDEELSNNVYEASGIYFVVTNDKIYEISDDASCTPRGGWFPEIVKGPTEEESKSMKTLMEELDFDEYFFDDMIDACGEFDEESALEYFEEENEEAFEIYKQIQEMVNAGKTIFENMEAFADVLRRYGLNCNELYYEWEGEWIPFYDNICETGESRGYYDNLSDEDWIEILENIREHKVEG